MTTIIKSTKYCDLMKQEKVVSGNSVYAIEEIKVKEKGTTEIRFAYYKINSDGKENFVPRPLDLKPDYLYDLLAKGIKSGILSKDEMKKILEN